METSVDENFLIKRSKLVEKNDNFAAKSWILCAKTLSPNDFNVQFEVYKQEKLTNNYIEAAKCFSHIILTFQSSPPELWHEITQLTNALRAPEDNLTSTEKFYVEMFKHISFDVQNKILRNLSTDNNVDHCKFILLLMKKFPQAIQSHLPRLLESLVQNNSTGNQQISIKILLLEVVPLMISRPPNDLSPNIVHRIMTLGLEFYTSQMFVFNNSTILPPVEFADMNLTTSVCWKRIFDIQELCGRILKWEPFLPYYQIWSKDVYWQKLIQIVSSTAPRPSENKQILFYGTNLFILSLQEYVNGLKHKIDDTEIRYVLIEGFTSKLLIN